MGCSHTEHCLPVPKLAHVLTGSSRGRMPAFSFARTISDSDFGITTAPIAPRASTYPAKGTSTHTTRNDRDRLQFRDLRRLRARRKHLWLEGTNFGRTPVRN